MFHQVNIFIEFSDASDINLIVFV